MGKALKVIGKFIIGNLYRVKEYNKPDLSNGSYILCPNHVSDADGPVMWTHNDNIRILAKKECFQHKFMAIFLNMIDVVKIADVTGQDVKTFENPPYLMSYADYKVYQTEVVRETAPQRQKKTTEYFVVVREEEGDSWKIANWSEGYWQGKW